MDKIKVRTLLEYRDVTYHKVTAEIFKLFDIELNKAVKLFIQNDRQVILEDITASTVPDHMRISAYSIPNVGDIIVNGEDKVVVTNENLYDFKLPMILTVPDRLLDCPDHKAIYRFLSALSDLNSKKPAEEVIDIIKTTKLEDLNGYYNLEDNKKVVEILTAPTTVDGFDTTGLSETQRQSIKFFMDKNTLQ